MGLPMTFALLIHYIVWKLCGDGTSSCSTGVGNVWPMAYTIIWFCLNKATAAVVLKMSNSFSTTWCWWGGGNQINFSCGKIPLHIFLSLSLHTIILIHKVHIIYHQKEKWLQNIHLIVNC